MLDLALSVTLCGTYLLIVLGLFYIDLRDILNQKGEPVIDPTLSSICPTYETHPKIRFWTKKDYENWLDSPEAQFVERGKEAYLKEEDSQPVPANCLGDIWACVHSAWCELINMKCAPQVWGQLGSSA